MRDKKTSIYDDFALSYRVLKKSGGLKVRCLFNRQLSTVT
ncbi:hypothetical protein PROFUN_08609 [Planoprotostelium fungivorum]|uniref:Uncharacterized protein n=1 Tax=Planoprotostelium fungivorum TaxID=1890364 RepID=A0A2P6NJ98_9EUKA|nr:hypothetical protein PROFUN_08609 [Planoprotostelium fungivorum]